MSECEPHVNIKQESPPAWMQEAYRPPCSKYFLCCAILADPPPAGPDPPLPPGWTWPTPPPPAGPDPPLPPLAGPDPPLPPRLDLTHPSPLAGPDPPLPPSWTWPTPPPRLDLTHPPWLDLTPPHGDPPPCGQTEGQTRVKTLPSPILRMRAVNIATSQARTK